MANIGNTNSPPTALTSCLHDNDTIARIALACAGVSGDPTVAVAIQTLGGALRFVAAVHDGRDAVAALSVSTRHRIRQFATVGNVIPHSDKGGDRRPPGLDESGIGVRFELSPLL